MTKPTWKSISDHIDPEKEEQMKWVKIELENQVKKVIKLTKNINHGNKERNLRNKSEAINLVEDFRKQYESLYCLYEDLREQVKKNVGTGYDTNSSSNWNSDSESYYSPGGSYTSRTNIKSNSTSKDSDCSSDHNQEPHPTSDLEETILKDKLTSSSEVKYVFNIDSRSEYGEAVKDLRVRADELENIISQKAARIKDLEGHVESLNIEISMLCMERKELKDQMECKSDEAMQMKERISRLEARVLETEAENERILHLVKQFEDNEHKYLSRISELAAHANDMQLELDVLRNQKIELEGRFLNETEKSSSQVRGLTGQIHSLKNELANVDRQKSEMKLELENKSRTESECLIRLENMEKESSLNKQRLAEEKEGRLAEAHDLESKIRSLISTNTEFEDQINKLSQEVTQSRVKISELQEALTEKENILSTEGKKFTDLENIMSTKTKSLEEEVENLKTELGIIANEKKHFLTEIETLRNDKSRLQMEVEKEKEESTISKSHVEKLSKSNFQVVERKVDEMADEFRKQLEDKYRILSRRIRVAEQLQVENKEWYRKTKETYEQQNKELKNRAERNEIELKNIKDMTFKANDVLDSLDSVALNFEECSANFLNRISKASCELKFAKHWAMRKNKAVLQVRDDLDCLLAQLDDKEAEVLVFREKVRKSENKIRELEKMVKEKEDAMLGLKEEKREAIRQLCVWIDYHRGRSDYYMKMLSEMNPVRKRASWILVKHHEDEEQGYGFARRGNIEGRIYLKHSDARAPQKNS
ncbi:hypothetical protein OROGR_005721 [Orobanche gracilis]